MRITGFVAAWALSAVGAASAFSTTTDQSSTAGIQAFVKRRIPNHAKDFVFMLEDAYHESNDTYDSYSVSSTHQGKIIVKGSTLSALMSG